MQVAEAEFFVVVVEMHTATFAIAEILTALALSFPGPVAVAVFVEPILPYIPE